MIQCQVCQHWYLVGTTHVCKTTTQETANAAYQAWWPSYEYPALLHSINEKLDKLLALIEAKPWEKDESLNSQT